MVKNYSKWTTADTVIVWIALIVMLVFALLLKKYIFISYISAGVLLGYMVRLIAIKVVEDSKK